MRKGLVVLAFALALLSVGSNGGSVWARQHTVRGWVYPNVVYTSDQPKRIRADVNPSWGDPVASALRTGEFVFGFFAVVAFAAAFLPARAGTRE